MVKKTSSKTPQHIVKRNRKNALKSTGPKTPKGRVRSRQNALKHGLCANPAAGVAEDATLFDQLLTVLWTKCQPENPIEEGLLHRIAVSLWRLNRSAQIDSAMSTLQYGSVKTGDEVVEHWIERINHTFYHHEQVVVKDQNILRKLVRQKRIARHEPLYVRIYPDLRYADRMREEELMADGSGIKAIRRLMNTLMVRLQDQIEFCYEDALLLAWLLGDTAERSWPTHFVRYQLLDAYPDASSKPSNNDRLIGEAQTRPAGKSVSDDILVAIRKRDRNLYSRYCAISGADRVRQEEKQKVLGLLPDAETLDRLLRYETHAERSLFRSLEMLAKMRCVPLSFVTDSITNPTSTVISDACESNHLVDGE